MISPFSAGSRRPGRPVSWVPAMLCILLVVGLSVSACSLFPASNFGGGTATPPPTLARSMTIEIGSDFATTGVDAANDLPLQYGVKMAIDQANEEKLVPGYTFTQRTFNDVGANNRFDPAVGTQNIMQAVADGLVVGVVGPGHSAVAKRELPVANQNLLPLLGPNNTFPCLTKDSTSDPACSGPDNILAQMRPTGQLTYFRVAATDDLQGKAVADYLFKTLGHRHVVIFKDGTDPYSQGLAQAFLNEWLALGGANSATPLDVPQADSNVSTYQSALQSMVPTQPQPDLIYFAGDTPNGSYALQALANIPALSTVAFAGSDGIIDSGFLQAASQVDRSAPIYASLPITDPAHADTTVGAAFQENYTSAGYPNYNPYVASAYDCTMILIQAVKIALQNGALTPHNAQDHAGARSFRKAVLQALAQLIYIGATGRQQFDTDGDTTNRTISFYRLHLSATQAEWQWLQPGPT